MGAFSRPDNLDYSQWKDALEDRVQSACGDSWMFKGPSWVFSQRMFRNLQSDSAAQALERYMLKEGSLNQYLNKRAGSMFMAIFGVVLLIVAILVALAAVHKVREFYSKACCGVCRERERPRLKQVPASSRRKLIFIVGGASLGALALIIAQLVASSRMLVDVKKVDCGMWMQLYGHFYGVENLSKDRDHPVTDAIAWQWGGTQPLLEDLEVLNQTTNPAIENNLLQQRLWGAMAQLQVQATAKEVETNATVDEWIKLADHWWNLAHGLSQGDTVTRSTWQEFLVGTANAVSFKGKVYKRDMHHTLEMGWQVMPVLMNQYIGPQAALLHKSAAATADSVSTINQMDIVIGVLAEKWDHLGPALVRSLRALASLTIVLSIIVFGIIPCVIAMAMTLRSRMKTDKLPSKKERTFWKSMFITTTVTGGFSALLCGLTLFLSGLGNDVCDLLEDGLLVRGQWDILGDDILRAPGVTIDVRRVMDTCIRSQGNGNVAAALALDARIGELAVEVDHAKDVVLHARDELLDRATNQLRVLMIKTGAEDIMDFIVRTQTLSDCALPAGYPTLPPTTPPRPALCENTYMRLLDTSGLPAPWFNDSWDQSEQPTLLCFIPGSAVNTPYGAWHLIVNECKRLGETGLHIRPVPLNIFYDALNDELANMHQRAAAAIPPIDLKLPKRVCSGTRNRFDSANAGCDSESTIIDHLMFSEWPTSQPANANGDDIWEWNQACYEHHALVTPGRGGAGAVWRTLLSAGRLEAFMQTIVPAEAGAVFCPGEAAQCTFYEAIQATRTETKRLAPRLEELLAELFGLVDDFVDGTTVNTMQSIVHGAYEVVENANCQFEGTALEAAAIMPLCEAIFPATTVTCLLMGLLTLELALLGRQLWKWYHYVEDVSARHGGDPVKYEESRSENITMSQRREFVELYTGVPVPERNSPHGAAITVEQPSSYYQPRSRDDN